MSDQNVKSEQKRKYLEKGEKSSLLLLFEIKKIK